MSGDEVKKMLTAFFERASDEARWEVLGYFEDQSFPVTEGGPTPHDVDERTRWRILGELVERRILQALSEAEPNRKIGRPSKPSISGIDARRAFCCWRLAQNLPYASRKKLTNREAIQLLCSLEQKMDIPISERAFPPAGSYDSSVSRGKKTLGIDEYWTCTSGLCEKNDAS